MDLGTLFQSPEHQPFYWGGDQAAALLVHGFPGTPAEMRPVGQLFREMGWTVQGLLLPGFGPEIDALADHTHADWVDAVATTLAGLQRHHHPVIVGGFSLGGALALIAAARQNPDGLLLLAPFWKIKGLLWRALPLFGLVFPVIRPFRLFKPDFSNPEFRRGLANFMPHLDLDDPAVQQGVRDFEIPISILEEVRRVGDGARQASTQVGAPALVIQGSQDRTVRPELTKELVHRLAGPARYEQVPGAHDLTDAGKPAWPGIGRYVREFARELEGD